MATVYRATDQRLQRDVALKIIHPHLASESNFVNRFIREARAAASLSSSHIVSVYDQGVAQTPGGERAYLVMELISGPNLRSQLQANGSLPLGVALDITHQVLEALGVAHANDIVHRDIKPENILLNAPIDITAVVDRAPIVAKVADFGLARAASDPNATHTGTMLGTVAYVPPELVSQGYSAPPSDVYSTGIMLYELISGALPFQGESPLSIAFAHVNQPMPRLSDVASWIPANVDSLIGLFTAKEPTKRPQTGTAALDALEDIVATIPQETLIRRVPVFPAAASPEHTLVGGFNPDATAELPRPHATVPLETAGSRTPPSPAPTQVIAAEPTPPTHVAKKRRRWPIAVFLILLLAVLGGGGGWWYFTMGPGQRVGVPSLEGRSYSEAVAELDALGLGADTERVYSDDIAKDVVISSDPVALTQVHPDSTVTLTVSDGVEMLEIPTVTGLSKDEAVAALTDARFAPEVTEAYSDTVPTGVVINQNPAPGDVVPHDSTVTLTVSLGREPVEIPDVEDEPRATAVATLEAAGLSPSISEAFSDDVDAGLVISQSPESGETGHRGDSVSIVVSLGPELVEVPNVFGMQEDEAKSALEEAGFDVKVEEDDFWGTIFGTVRSQTPAAGSKARPGSEITIYVV